MKLKVSALAFFFLCTTLLICGMVDSLRTFKIGSLTMLAAYTVLSVAVPLAFLLHNPKLSRSYLFQLWPLIAFVGWGGLSLAWSTDVFAGSQNLLVSSAFLALSFLSYHVTLKDDRSREIVRMLEGATWFAMGLYAIGLVTGGLGGVFPLGARTFAVFCLIGLACFIAAWRYGSLRGRFWAIVSFAIIAVSLSRAALAAALILFPLAQIVHRSRWGWLRPLLGIVLILGLSILAVTYIEPLRARFMEGDTSLQVGGIGINASGRTKAWAATLISFADSPWIGKGAGSAQLLIQTLFPGPGLGHPHSDFLRIMHDFGVVGLALWLMGLFKLFAATWRAWAHADRFGNPSASLHLAAFLALISSVVVMATDNSMVYLFVMAPLGILVGTSLASAERTRRLA